MKDIAIRVVTKEALDDELAQRAETLLTDNGYRNVIIEQFRRFDDGKRVAVFAVADHDLKRPPGILRTMKAAVLSDIEGWEGETP